MAAARLILFGILFTEVLEPAVVAGGIGVGSTLGGKSASKSGGLDFARNSGVSFVQESKGDVFIGRRSVTLSCYAGSPNVTWLLNQVPAPPCGATKCNVLHNGSLHLYKKRNAQMQKYRDSNGTVGKVDEYRCIAQTNFGGLLRSSKTSVYFAELARGFRESPKDAEVQEGEVVRFSCSIDSVPLSNITWLHNGNELKIRPKDSKYYIIPLGGVLYINSVKLSDAGSYRCLATNDYLNKTKKSKEAKLTVLLNYEDLEGQKPSVLFPQVQYSYSLLNGSSINLACAASGLPAQGTVWSFVPLQTDVAQPLILLNSSSNINVLKLESISASDAGYYLCSLANSIKYQNITIKVLVPPKFTIKPTNQVCPNGITARFECQAEGVPMPRIYWFKDAENITIRGRRTVYEKELNKSELAIAATVPSDSGVYQCVAVNDAGEIWAAGRLQVNTSRNSPAALSHLKCRSVSPVRMIISWDSPKFLSHASITAYTVHYSRVEGGKEEVSPPEPGNSTSVEVTKLLEPYTNYSFYVRVWNNHGASNQSASIVCLTAPSVPKSAPKIKLELLSSTKLKVSWTPLTKEEARGIITEYKLQWSLHNKTTSFRVQLLPVSVEYFILKDLIPGQKYDVRVLARTKQGWPNNSESFPWSSIRMPISDEDQFSLDSVMQLDIININQTAAKVSWKMKDDIQNHISQMFGFWEVYFEDKEGKKMLSMAIPKNVTVYMWNDPELSSARTVGLCMKNEDDYVGCLVEPVKATHSSFNTRGTLEAAPLSANSIHLKWSTANFTNNPVYEVCYHAVHKSVESMKCMNTTNSEIVVNKLKPFTLYQFKVKTVGNASSIFSETIECYSKEDVPGKIEGVQWFLTNKTTVRVAWKEPNKVNGLIKKYLVSYTTDLTEPSSDWETIEVNGNRTFANLPTLLSGKRYFVMVQASTQAGFGKLSDPIMIVTGGVSSKILTPSDKQKPQPNMKPDQSLGIILGVGISIVFVTICLCSMYCRRKCETSRILRHSAQARKMHESNGCCIERASTSTSQHNVSINKSGSRIELAVLCPVTPVNNQHVDTKGVTANGIVEPCVKEPLLMPWEANGDCRDAEMIERQQVNRSNLEMARAEQFLHSEDLDSTQLTMINCSLRASNSSLNNNLACAIGDLALEKAPHLAAIPVLGPNG